MITLNYIKTFSGSSVSPFLFSNLLYVNIINQKKLFHKLKIFSFNYFLNISLFYLSFTSFFDIMYRIINLKEGIFLISTSNLSVQFGGRKLFDEVDIKFTPGNCYGIIGPNGAGKSTFLKILTGEAESTSGEVIIDKNKRLSFLKQDHFAYEDEQVLNVVMMGHTKLYDIMMKKYELYSKTE